MRLQTKEQLNEFMNEKYLRGMSEDEREMRTLIFKSMIEGLDDFSEDKEQENKIDKSIGCASIKV